MKTAWWCSGSVVRTTSQHEGPRLDSLPGWSVRVVWMFSHVYSLQTLSYLKDNGVKLIRIGHSKLTICVIVSMCGFFCLFVSAI